MPSPAPAAAPAEGSPAAGSLPAAAVFPPGDWQAAYDYDDGTGQNQHEWWLREGDRVVAVDGHGVYAVWYVRPDGIYRRGPLGGGAGAPLLRYLPLPLQADLAWQQQSGDAVVRFWLGRSAGCGGYYADPGGGGEACWELNVLDRGQLQQFEFLAGHGIVAASELPPDRPQAARRKVAVRSAGDRPLPDQ